MSKRILYLLLSCFFLIPIASNSSNLAGGTLSWECLPSGEYVFKVRVYTECVGPLYNPSPSGRVIDVSGSSLPMSNVNVPIYSIQLFPRTALNTASRRDLSPECVDSTQNLSCLLGNRTMQKFEFISQPIRLFGTPPNQGWRFQFDPGVLGSSVENMGSSFPVFRAIMYANSSNGSCNDNSPVFAERPPFLYCRSQLRTNVDPAIDFDGDQLKYFTDFRLADAGTITRIVPYFSPYSVTSPLPAVGSNVPFSMDSLNGRFQFQVNNSTGAKLYTVVKRVDSYRNNQLMASVFHDYPYYIYDCPNLPNQLPNTDPWINPPFFKGGPNFSFSYADSIVVGNRINVNLSARDTNNYNNGYQSIKIRILGGSIANDLTTTTNCPNPTDTNCARMLAPPQYNSARNQYYYTSAVANWLGTMTWQTDCADLNEDGSARTHYFYVIAQDDFCPIPGTSTEIIAITVLADTSVCPPVVTSIDLLEKNAIDLAIYPNPSNGQVFINLNEEQNMILQIFNTKGKLMDESIVLNTNEPVNLPSKSGVYLLRLTDQSGRSYFKKVVRR